MSIYPPTGTLEIKNATLKIPVVDLQYTSNTAKLEANSNVVTEFSRSKKLIKYPRVLLTSAALNSAYENGYRVTFSSENTSYRAYHPFSRDENSAVGWYSGSGTAGVPYDGTGGLYGTSGTARLAAETERGEWLGLELPVAIKLERLRMVSQSYSTVVNTIDDFIVYAKKQSGDTWTNIGTFTGIAPLQTSADGAMFDVNVVEYYKFFAIVATKRYTAAADSGVSIRVLEYFGVPEYDPDADGTDVTLKSLANVPNTDWLEIYYDAKDLEDGAVTNPISGLGGTTNGGTAVGDTQVSNGAFVFDGSGDYIYNSQSGYTSRVVYTGCAWIKKASKTNGCIFQFGNGSNNSGIGLFSFGSPTETKTMRAFVYGGAAADYKEDVPLNEWFHVVAVISDKKATLYLNGVVAATDTGSYTITIPSTPYLSLGVQTNSSNTPISSTYFDGSIANFRLFNRNLTADEVYQLYAYQKEYFGHSTNNLTLKAGRLGIGTSEPRAALDVRGGGRVKPYGDLLDVHGAIRVTGESPDFLRIRLGNYFSVGEATGLAVPETLEAGRPLTDNPRAGSAIIEYTGGESTTTNEGAHIWLNGDTIGIMNTGDRGTLHWYDSDHPSDHTTSGRHWQISTSGGITNSSDLTLKNNIRYFDDEYNTSDSMLKYSQIKFCKYNWKKELKDPSRVKEDFYGVIAQEIEPLFPEMIQADAAGLKMLKQERLQYISYHMIANLIQKNADLEARISALENA